MKKYIPRPRAREYITILLLVLEVTVMGLVNKGIFSSINMTQVIQNAAEMSLICIGMNMVMLLGGIDLSIGGIMGVSAIVAGYMIQAGVNTGLVIATAVMIGVAFGALNGFLIAKLKIPDMVATLATMNIFRAAIFFLLGGKWITGLKPDFGFITRAKVLGVPLILFLILALYVLFYWLTNHTAFGRRINAVGSNEKSAALCGIRPDQLKLSAYMIIGALAGMAALLYISRMGSVEMQIGANINTECIAAVIVGGMGVGGIGGKSTLLGTLAGVFFISFMRNGIVILGIPSLLEYFVIGALILTSLVVDIAVYMVRNHARPELGGQR